MYGVEPLAKRPGLCVWGRCFHQILNGWRREPLDIVDVSDRDSGRALIGKAKRPLVWLYH